MISTRTWPYGTVKHGRIVWHIASGAGAAVFVADDEADDPFILFGQTELIKVRSGQKGSITFTEGGLTGGYWRWEPKTKTKGTS